MADMVRLRSGQGVLLSYWISKPVFVSEYCEVLDLLPPRDVQKDFDRQKDYKDFAAAVFGEQ